MNMNECFRMKICMLVLLFGQSQAGLAEEREMSQPVRLAVGPVDPEGGRPSCEADGICRINECSNDPDCPRDLPNNTTRPTGTANALDEVINCDSTQEKDIRAVAWNIADDWINFERSIEDQTGFKLGNCGRDRFKKNGKVECVKEYDCKTKNGIRQCKLGYGWGLGQKIKIYQTFLDKMASSSMSQADRRACYAGLMTHEFAHTCERYAERGPEARADTAVAYWKGQFPVSSSLDPQVECGFND